MLKRNLWKLLLSVLIAVWAVTQLVPIRNIPFPTYVRAHVTAKPAEFGKLLDEAAARVAAGQASSEFVALKAIAHERKLDLAQYFPDLEIEGNLPVDRRNDILLNELDHRAKAKLQRGLDLAGGVSVTLEVDPRAAGQDRSDSARQDKLNKAIEIISARVNSFGVAEPLILPVGDNRIRVEMPGLNPKENPEVVENIKKPARLEFHLVHPTLDPSEAPAGEVPPGYEVLTLDDVNGGPSRDYFIKRIPEMTGEMIADSHARPNEYGKPEVELSFTSAGKARFAQMTQDIVTESQKTGRIGFLSIVLDGKLEEVASVREAITGGAATISGGAMSDRDAIDLSNDLNNPLDLPLIVKQQEIVGPSLATDTISSAIKASIIGTALVAGFMITYYTIGGLVAVCTLAVNIMIILGVMASFGATMTLPGLAGIVLTVGMAVDANILIFERMREELKLGKPLRTALSAGYDKAFITIIDAHVTQLCVCAIMIYFGTGSIRGFGLTLAIGVFSTMFSVLVTGHLVMEWLIGKDIVRKFPMLHLLHTETFDFVKWYKPAFLVSWTIILLGMGMVFYKGHKIYGIDFAGGDVVSVSYRQKLDPALIRRVVDANHLGDVNPTYVSSLGGGSDLLNIETEFDRSPAVLSALQAAYPQAQLEKVGEDHIGPSIGAEVEWNAFEAIALSMLVILIYVAFRFEFGFAVGAVVASVHDILMTIGVFVLSGRQFSAPMVAAILSIAGYSINDTIVVFDRIREELRLNPDMKLRDVINLGINRVFSRSVMTSFTAFLAALALYVFGTGVMNDLSFTFIVGIVTGTFSSIFIASPIFYWWHKGDRKHVEAHADVTPKYEWTGSSKASE
jgi:SecD/SecF fusion protein